MKKTSHQLRYQARKAVSNMRFKGYSVERIELVCYNRWLDAKSTDAEIILGTMVAVARREI